MLNTIGLDLEIVENKLRDLKNDVKLIYFTQEAHCVHCKKIQIFLERLSSVTKMITFISYNFAINKKIVQEYKIFTIPALAIIGEKDYGIRYYGYFHGLEIYDFLNDIVYVSRGDNTLMPESTKKLSQLKDPLQLKIFISSNCPYSLPIARLAVKLAVASDAINADIIHADEFPELAEKYNVRGIPFTVVNEDKSFYGALDQSDYLNHIVY